MSTEANTALITGASLGIGLELAKLFAARKIDVVLVARNGKRLQEIAEKLVAEHGIRAHVIPLDLIDPKSTEKLMRELQERDLKISYLVNNAGFGVWGRFVETSLTDELGMIQLNVSALTDLSKRFSIQMKDRGFGRIMNVASVAAFQPGPLMAVYYATKAYVVSFSEALHNELGGSGVTVTTFCPGPTETGFQQAAKMGHTQLFKRGVMTAACAAKIGFEGMMRGRGLVIPGLRNRIFAMSGKLTPGPIAAKIARRLQEGRGL